MFRLYFKSCWAVEEYIYESQPVAFRELHPLDGILLGILVVSGAVSNLVLSSTTSPSEGFAKSFCIICFGRCHQLLTHADNSQSLTKSKNYICLGYPFSYTPNASDAKWITVYSWDEPLDDFFTNFNPPIDRPLYLI